MSEFSQWDRAKHSHWIDEMDSQHHELVFLLDSLYRCDSERAPKSEVSALLDMLRECTVHHFKEEEAFMAATGYDRLDVHQLIHRDLMLGLTEHVARFKAGSGRLSPELMSYLEFWLAAHITGADRQRPRRGASIAPTTSLLNAGS